MASASYLDSGDEMSGMTWGDCGFNAFLCSPPASPFADKDPVFGHEWACFETHPMDVEAVAFPMLISEPSEPLESAYSFNAVTLARSGSGKKVMEAQDEEVFVLSNTVKKRLREKSKASQRKKARKQQEADSCCLRRAGANKKVLSDFRAILDSKTTSLTPDERELIRRYVVLLETEEHQRTPILQIVRILRPLTSDLPSCRGKTSDKLNSKLRAIRSEYKRGDRDISKVKAREDARLEKHEQALTDYCAILGSKTTRLSSDERELIVRYIALHEKAENQRKSCLDIMRILQPLIGHLKSFFDRNAMQLRAKISKIRFEYKNGFRDLSKTKVC
jgi:hypothetical protein